MPKEKTAHIQCVCGHPRRDHKMKGDKSCRKCDCHAYAAKGAGDDDQPTPPADPAVN